MPEIKTEDEQQLYEAAYDQWVTEARENGRNTEPETFRAGWLAGLAFVKGQQDS